MISAYFAYGSNMNPERMRQRGLRFVCAQAAELPGHTLVFDKRVAHRCAAGHANIRYQVGATVHGVLYRLAEPELILVMDPYEQAPINYGREIFQLVTQVAAVRRETPAWVYVGNPGVLQDGLRPEPEYMAHLLAGAAYLPADYLARLRNIECLPPTR